jgi:hypothetical protein
VVSYGPSAYFVRLRMKSRKSHPSAKDAARVGHPPFYREKI